MAFDLASIGGGGIASLQTGVVTPNGDTDITISSVDTSKSVVYIHAGMGRYRGGGASMAMCPGAELTSSTNLRVYHRVVGGIEVGSTAGWAVVEYS